jgi:hypothetical protein
MFKYEQKLFNMIVDNTSEDFKNLPETSDLLLFLRFIIYVGDYNPKSDFHITYLCYEGNYVYKLDSYRDYEKDKYIRVNLAVKTDSIKLVQPCIGVCTTFGDEIYTYVIFDTHNNIFKLGKSKNPQDRLLKLKTANPNLELLYHWPIDIENTLHKMYQHSRLEREWFKFQTEDYDKFIQLCKLLDSFTYIT